MRYIQGHMRNQTTLLPETLDDAITEEDPVRVIDAFVLCKSLIRVNAEMSLGVLAYQLKRIITIIGVKEMIKAMA